MEGKGNGLRLLTVVMSLFLSLCWTIHPAWADLTMAKAAYERGDYTTAAHEYIRLAQEGNAEAQYMSGLLCETGLGVPQNPTEALTWYRTAAEQGLAKAHLIMGLKHESGEGVPRSSTEAVKRYRKAAQAGDASAQYILGFKYEKGEGVPQDYVQAYLWFGLSGEQGLHGALTAREVLTGKMTPEQRGQGERLLTEWKSKKEQ